MSSESIMEEWISSADFSNRYKLRTTEKTVKDNKIVTEITKRLDASTVNSKLDFFRSMGLNFTNCCDINGNNTDHDLQTSYRRHCRSVSTISEKIGKRVEEIPEEIGLKSGSKHKNAKKSEIRDTVGYHKIFPFIRECKVTIIGEKCKICGRSFKCIRDVQVHIKKKHRRKKPRKNLVFKIGDEVISRVPIKRKHLKWHKEKNRTIDSNDDATFLWEEEDFGSYQISDEEIAPFVDFGRNCDTNKIKPCLMDIDKSGIALQGSEDTPRDELTKHRKDEDEEIQVVLKITRPLKSMEINHETPNRNERERLLSDAIQEFIRMDNDLIKMVKPTHDHQIYRENIDILEGCRRLANSRLQNGNLENEENNFTFHINNADDIDCGTLEDNLFSLGNNEYFNDETSSMHSQHYRNENGDIIPDFIDYTRCLDDRTSHHHNNNNNVYELDSLFYHETQTDVWKKATYDPKPVGFDIRQNTSRNLDALVLIKEEIMLDDLL